MVLYIVNIITWLLNFVSLPFSALSSSLALTNILSAMYSGMEFVYWVFDYVNFLVPIDVVFTCIGVIITIHIAQIVYNSFNWILVKICQLL